MKLLVVALTLIVHLTAGRNQDFVGEVIEAFANSLDTNGDGFLSKDEFVAGGTPESELSEVYDMTAWDTNNDGKVSISVFVAYHRARDLQNRDSFYHINEIFSYLDANADGAVSREELDEGCRDGTIPQDTWRIMFSMGSFSLSQFSDFVKVRSGINSMLNYGDWNKNEIVQNVDANKDGYIDQNEYGKLIGFDEAIPDSFWAMVCAEGDKNGDGKISWMEWKCGDNVAESENVDDNCLCFLNE